MACSWFSVDTPDPLVGKFNLWSLATFINPSLWKSFKRLATIYNYVRYSLNVKIGWSTLVIAWFSLSNYLILFLQYHKGFRFLPIFLHVVLMLFRKFTFDWNFWWSCEALPQFILGYFVPAFDISQRFSKVVLHTLRSCQNFRFSAFFFNADFASCQKVGFLWAACFVVLRLASMFTCVETNMWKS